MYGLGIAPLLFKADVVLFGCIRQIFSTHWGGVQWNVKQLG